jgi:carbon storage regulator CsrA
MLVLSRRVNEKIVFPGVGATVQVVSLKPGVVRLGIEAPPDVTVLRAEVRDRQAEWAEPAPAAAAHPGAEEELRQLRRLVRQRLEVARTGLAALERQIADGRSADAAETLRRIDEDLQLLEGRVDGAARGVAPRIAARHARTALVVEDNANERELLALFLRNAGLDVATASDGADALDYLHSRGRPDVVLLDMGLPRCDGASVVRAVRRDPAYADLKIFAVSGHRREEFDLPGGPAGVDRWFNKPIDPADLVRGMNQDLQPAGGPA